MFAKRKESRGAHAQRPENVEPQSSAPSHASTVAVADLPPISPVPKWNNSQLGGVLVELGLASDGDVERALGEQLATGGRLGQILVGHGVLTEDELVKALAKHFDMPVADLHSHDPDPNALSYLPESIAREQLVIAVRLVGDYLEVAVTEPSTELRQLLSKSCGHEIVLSLAPAGDIRRAIERSYRAIGGMDRLVEAFQATEGSRRRTNDTAGNETTIDDAPIVQIVNRILAQGLQDRASDIHLEPQQDFVRIRFRIDGALKEILVLPVAMGLALVSRIKIMAEMNIVERRRAQDGQFTTVVSGTSIDVRVATVATIWGEKCVLRILDKTRSVYRLSDLGMVEHTHATYARLVRSPFGMVLCAGPTGSGKTTTLYATLNELNDPSRNIMTIEDPVEYVFPQINQLQTHEQAGLTFATGLRAILRQDPDIILVGEIRDVETAQVAVQSALTGHFVLSSLHATDSVAAIHRFLDMGIESFLIASSVLAIVGQRLVRRICPSCRVPYELSDEERAFYDDAGGPQKFRFYRGEGCNFCSGTGYQERIGVYELLRMTPEIKRLIVGWATQDELRRQAQKQGMRTLREEAINLVVNDITTVAEVVRSIYSL